MHFSDSIMKRLFMDEKCRHFVRPATDVLEDAKGYTVRCIMPGLRKDDIYLELRDNELCLEGAAQLDLPPGMHVHSLEFCSSLYRLRLALPGDADGAGVLAEYSDGVLTLSLPRKKQALIRRVDVSLP